MNQFIIFAVTFLIGVGIKPVYSNTLLGWGPDYLKAGNCPESDADLYYSDSFKNECLQDDDCLDKKKCCFQESSGHLCLDPITITKAVKTKTCNAERRSTKPGYCPRPDYTMNCIQCNDNCISDCDCVGEFQKCCPQPGCGNMCKDATNVPNNGWTSANCN